MTDTDLDKLAERKQRTLFRFDPTVSSGTLIELTMLLLVVGGAWATFQSDRATTRLELDALKAQAQSEKSATKESLAEIKGDLRELQRTLVQVNQTVAVIEARQPRTKDHEPGR